MTTVPVSRSDDRPFTSSVFIAASLDGFIARMNGDIDWLTSRGENAGDTGYQDFMDSIDALVMGRNTYDKVLTFGQDQWPYDGKHVAVLSTQQSMDADPRIAVHRDLDGLVQGLIDLGVKHVYVDGGQIVQSFLRAGLLDTLTITAVPVLLGTGIPLFGPLEGDVTLTHRSTKVLGAGFVQSTYAVARQV